MMRLYVTEVNIAEHLSFICTLDGVHTIVYLPMPYCTELQTYSTLLTQPSLCLFLPKSGVSSTSDKYMAQTRLDFDLPLKLSQVTIYIWL